MNAEHIAAAHAETKTCNAAASSPLTCHSLACRTKAMQLSRPAPAPRPAPVLTLVRRAA